MASPKRNDENLSLVNAG